MNNGKHTTRPLVSIGSTTVTNNSSDMDEATGIKKRNESSENKCFPIIRAIDHIISIFVMAPLVISYWRGCWGLSDVFIYPSNPIISAAISLIIGIILAILSCLIGKTLEHIYSHEKHPIKYMWLSRTFTFVFCFATVSHWRGVWQLWHTLAGYSVMSSIASIVVGVSVLILTRSVNNLMGAVPFLVLTDHSEGMYQVSTIFKKMSDDFGLRLLDLTYTVALILSAVITLWKGIWTLLDILFFPNAKLYSALGSLFIGVCITFFGIMIQIMFGSWLKKLNYGIKKITFQYAFFFVCTIAVVNIWRGYWYLLDIYLFPLNIILSYVTSFVIGIAVLMILFAGKTITGIGAIMDSEEDEINFKNEYLIVFHKKKNYHSPCSEGLCI